MAADDELARLRPTEGARFLLELGGVVDGGASYLAWLLTPAATFAYQAALTDDGGVTLTPAGEAAPDELATMLATIARLTARAAAGKRDAGLPPWPARVLRWRGPGR